MELFVASGEKKDSFSAEFICFILGQGQYHHCRCGFAELDPSHPMLLRTAPGCCCFWSFPLLLHETGMMLARSAAAQPALTSSPRERGTGDPFVPSRGAEQGTAALQQCRAALGAWHLAAATTAEQVAFFSPVRTQRNPFSK